jgi:DNA-binding transcriptional MerR regulator
MLQQLFLFDKENEQKEEVVQQTATANDMHDNESGDELISNNENKGEENTTAPNNADPFASIREKEEKKIEQMLLMPNTRRGRKSFKDMDEESILVSVPDDEELFQKQYYPMRTVAEWFGITLSQLRKWENEFDILQPKKNARGDRYFRPEDVKNLELIYHLIRKRKFTVAGAKQFLKENKKNLRNTVQLLDALNKFKQFLLELRAISE